VNRVYGTIVKRKIYLKIKMNYKSVIDEFKSSCDIDIVSTLYCETASFGKGCKELKTCEKYKCWKAGVLFKDKRKNMDYIND